jgi:CheY-like chemotaxis protein
MSRDRPGRVLVVDDEQVVCQMLRDFLTTVGDEVAEATSGAEALGMVATFRPDVILVDMVMRGMSGVEVLDAMRRARVTVPVILLTGHMMKMPEGFFAILRKPFDLRKLAEAVSAATRHARGESA